MNKKKKTAHPLRPSEAREIQDEIFRKMSADRKIKLGSQLWQMAKDLVGDKINYGTSRSQTSLSKNRKNS